MSADAGPVLETPYSTSADADTAVANYFGLDNSGGGGGDEGGGGGGGGGGGWEDQYGVSAVLSGTLDAPASVEQGQGFEATATVSNTSPVGEAGTFVLAITDGQGASYRLDSVQSDVGAGETVEMVFTVPRGALQNPPGSYSLGVVAQTPNGSGTVAVSNISVAEDPSGGESSEWGEVVFEGELDFGWNLYSQSHRSEDKERFMVSAKDENGNVIYLTESGGISSSIVFFDDIDAVAAALAQFVERLRDGEWDDGGAPDPSQPRPTVEELQSAAATTGMLGGGSLFGFDVMDIGIVGLAVLVLVMQQTGRIKKKNATYAIGGLAVALVLTRVGGVL